MYLEIEGVVKSVFVKKKGNLPQTLTSKEGIQLYFLLCGIPLLIHLTPINGKLSILDYHLAWLLPFVFLGHSKHAGGAGESKIIKLPHKKLGNLSISRISISISRISIVYVGIEFQETISYCK